MDLKQTKSAADQMCSMHAHLRDIFERRALLLDLAILILTLWLTALAFVDPVLAVKLTPIGIESRLWVGLIAVAAFALAIVQIRVEWKALASSHARAAEAYGIAKIQFATLAALEAPGASAVQAAAETYDAIRRTSLPIPERWFLSLKRAHHSKVALSRLIDSHPGQPLLWLRMKLFLGRNSHRDRQ